ncbi:MAG: nuclear transport factor 2 family protein [Verrucomicrobiota bacterium]
MNVPPEPRASAPTTDLKAWAQDWIAAWNSHDLERILSHYADEVEFHSPFVARLLGNDEGCLKGIGALRDYFARGLKSYPGLHFEFRRVYPGSGSCILEYTSVQNLRAAEMMEWDSSGKIRRVRAHYDQTL